MSDFITISCPSCGGQLTRRASAATCTCDYCGQRHRVPKEEIEEFGHCPVCLRIDSVEIARAIHNRGGNLASLFAPPENPEKAFKYNPKKKPSLIEKPIYIPTPLEDKNLKFTKFVYFLSLILVMLFCALASSSESGTLPLILLFLGLAGLIFYYIMLVKAKIDNNRLNAENKSQFFKNWEMHNEEIETKWLLYIEKYDHYYRNRYALLEENYTKAKKRYDQLYYCHRDDCVFIPGESDHAPSDMVEEFLLNSEPEKLHPHHHKKQIMK